MRLSLSGGSSVYGLRPHSSGAFAGIAGAKKCREARVLLLFPSSVKGMIRSGQEARVVLNDRIVSSIRSAAKEAADRNATVKLTVAPSDFTIPTDEDRWGEWKLSRDSFTRQHQALMLSQTSEPGQWKASDGRAFFVAMAGDERLTHYPNEKDYGRYEVAQSMGCPESVICAAKAQFDGFMAGVKSRLADAAARQAAEQERIDAGREAREFVWETEILPQIMAWIASQDEDRYCELSRGSPRGGEAWVLSYDEGIVTMCEQGWSFNGGDSYYESGPLDMDVLREFFVSQDGVKLEIG